MGFKRVYTKKTYQSKIFELEFRDYLDDDNNLHRDIAVLDSADAANVIPVTNGKCVLMVKQYRFGIEDYTIEIPGGLCEKEEDKLIAVKRELREETGYTADNWTFLGSVYSNPVFITNQIHHFIAIGASKDSDQQLDFDEEIELLEMPISDLIEKLDGGFFRHPHTISALNLARTRLIEIHKG